jgi:hypothetical protein
VAELCDPDNAYFDDMTSDTTEKYTYYPQNLNKLEYLPDKNSFKFTYGNSSRFLQISTSSNELNIKDFRGKKATFKAHVRPSDKVRLGIHYKTQGKYINKVTGYTSKERILTLTTEIPQDTTHIVFRIGADASSSGNIVLTKDWLIYSE